MVIYGAKVRCESMRAFFFVHDVSSGAPAMIVIERIADYMGKLLDDVRGHRTETSHLQAGQVEMAATLKSIQDKLASVGQQIEQLVAAKTKAEQDDLDAIDAAIDSNVAKVTAALTPAPVTTDGPTLIPTTG